MFRHFHAFLKNLKIFFLTFSLIISETKLAKVTPENYSVTDLPKSVHIKLEVILRENGV